MKKSLIVVAFTLTYSAYSFANNNVNIHDAVNNAQAQAHQQQSSRPHSAIAGKSQSMAELDQHRKAAMVHENMNNGSSAAHQNIADMHKKMMVENSQNNSTAVTQQSYSQMNEHEKAAIAHENMKNGDAEAHRQQANKHREMMKTTQ